MQTRAPQENGISTSFSVFGGYFPQRFLDATESAQRCELCKTLTNCPYSQRCMTIVSYKRNGTVELEFSRFDSVTVDDDIDGAALSSNFRFWQSTMPHKYITDRNTRPCNGHSILSIGSKLLHRWRHIHYISRYFPLIPVISRYLPRRRFHDKADESAFPHSALESVTNTEDYAEGARVCSRSI